MSGNCVQRGEYQAKPLEADMLLWRASDYSLVFSIDAIHISEMICDGQ